MVSHYLTMEAAVKRKAALVKRILAEAIMMDDGSRSFAPESDFWLLPKNVQAYILQRL